MLTNKIIHKSTINKNFLLSYTFDLNNQLKLTDLLIFNKNKKLLVGNIYYAKVTSINENGIFVSLNYKNTRNSIQAFLKSKNKLFIGDNLIVQIHKDSLDNKKIVVSDKIILNATFLSLTLNTKHHNKNFVLNDDLIILYNEVKEILSNKLTYKYIKNYSFNISDDILQIPTQNQLNILSNEILYLLNILNNINNMLKIINANQEISVLYEDNYIIKFINKNIINKTSIYTDCKQTFLFLQEYIKKNKHIKELFSLLSIKIELQTEQQLINLNTIQQLKKLLINKVDLLDSAYLLIESNATLTSIDINSGTFKKQSKEYNLIINKLAFTEIVQQIKLRNLTGIIIVDFINMNDNRLYKELSNYITDKLSNSDIYFVKNNQQSKININLTNLSLAEFTRERIYQSLLHSLTNSIDYGIYKKVTIKEDLFFLEVFYSLIEYLQLYKNTINHNKLDNITLLLSKDQHQDFLTFLNYEQQKTLKYYNNEFLNKIKIIASDTIDHNQFKIIIENNITKY